MKKFVLSVSFTIIFSFLTLTVFAQEGGRPAPPPPPPMPAASQTPKISDTLAQNLSKQTADVSRENREQAYAKLLEGQRYIWGLSRTRSQVNVRNSVAMAKISFQKAIELNPKFAEAYTGLAELFLLAPPRDAEEALKLSEIAVKLDADNFGAHRISARIYTLKSRLAESELDPVFSKKAIEGWKEITRLDPRYMEGWAFLAAFYEKLGQRTAQIDALNNWLGAAAPLDPSFYRTVMGPTENLAPEQALIKLGAALIAEGKTREALEILSRAISDDPDNAEAVQLLSEAVESSDAKTANIAVEALKQAINANPENLSLIGLLADVNARAGRTDEAATVLRQSITLLETKDSNAAANLQISLGDIYSEADRFDEAIAVYQNALRLRGIKNTDLLTEDERDFAILAYAKIIQTYKSGGRIAEAKSVIESTRQIFGKTDQFADRQLIDLYNETGKKPEALKVVRAMRLKEPGDYMLMRLEATILTDTGKVDEAVALIQPLIGKTTPVPSIMNDDFINYLFISGLYSQAKRGAQAIESANRAYAATEDEGRKQIARLTLATAQQMSGDFAGAETTLRDILKQSPGNPIALNNLGYFLLERDVKYKEAFELIEQAVKIDPNNPSYLDSLGWAYFKLGNFTEAEKYLKKAIKLDPASATIHDHLGDVYQKLSRTELAKVSWQKALDLSSDADEISRLKIKLKK